MVIVLLARSFTIGNIFTVKICMTLIFTFKMDKGQKQIYQWKGCMQLSLCGNCNVFLIHHHWKIFTVKMCMIWTIQMGQGQVL